MKNENSEEYRVSAEPNSSREWMSCQQSGDDESLSTSFMTPCSRYDDEISGTISKVEEEARGSVPVSFIPDNFDSHFIHGKHRCIVCDVFPIIGYRLHCEYFKPDEGCCYTCFKELLRSGSKEKRDKWLSSFIPTQLDSDVDLQDEYRAQFVSLPGTSWDDNPEQKEVSLKQKSPLKLRAQNIVETIENKQSLDNDKVVNYCLSEHTYSPNAKYICQVGSQGIDNSDKGKSQETFFSDDDLTPKENDIKVHLCILSDDETIQTQKDVFIAFESDKNHDDEVSFDYAGSNSSFPEESFEVVMDDDSFQILDSTVHGISKKNPLLTRPLFESLSCFLPEELSCSKIWLNYSLQRDEASLHTLAQNAGSSATTLMIIQTSNGDVFGCYTSSPWKFHSGHYGCGSSFVWRMRHKRSASYSVGAGNLNSEEKIQVFPKSHSDSCVQFCSKDMLGIGKGCGHYEDIELYCHENQEKMEQFGFAILLYGDLRHGRTSPSASFSSPRLIDTEDGIFEVFNIEVWSFANSYSFEDEEEIDPRQYLKLPCALSFRDDDIFGLDDSSNIPYAAKEKNIALSRDDVLLSQTQEPEIIMSQMGPPTNAAASHAVINQNSSTVNRNDVENCPTHHLDESSFSLFCCDEILSVKAKRKSTSSQITEGDGIDNKKFDIAQTPNDSSVSFTPRCYETEPSHVCVDYSASHDVDQIVHNNQTFTDQTFGSSVGKETEESDPQNDTTSSCGVRDVIANGDYTLPEKNVTESRLEERMDKALANPLWLHVNPDQNLTLRLNNNIITSHQVKAIERFFFRIQKTPIEVFKLNRHNIWQKRFLTVSNEVGTIQYNGEEELLSPSCSYTIPLALLWVKKRSIANVHSISSIDKQGRGGIFLKQIISNEIETHSEIGKNAILTKKQIQMNMVTLAIISESDSTIFCMDKSVAREFAEHCNALIKIFAMDFESQQMCTPTRGEFRTQSLDNIPARLLKDVTLHCSQKTNYSPNGFKCYSTSKDISSSLSDENVGTNTPRALFQESCMLDVPEILDEVSINGESEPEYASNFGNISGFDKDKTKDSVITKGLEINLSRDPIETLEIELLKSNNNGDSEKDHAANMPKVNNNLCLFEKVNIGQLQIPPKMALESEEDVATVKETRQLTLELDKVNRLNGAVGKLTKLTEDKVYVGTSSERTLDEHLESEIEKLKWKLSYTQDAKTEVEKNLTILKESFVEEVTCAIELQKELEQALEDKQSEVCNLLNLIEVERKSFLDSSFSLKDRLKRNETDIEMERQNISLLQSQLNSLESEKMNLEGIKNELQTEIARYIVAEESLQTENSTLKTIAEQHKNELENLKRKLKSNSEENDSKIEQVKEEMQQEHEVSMQKLRDELNSRKDTEVAMALEAAHAEYERLQAESESACAVTLEQVKSEALASESKLVASVRDEYESRLSAVEASHKDAVHKVEEEYTRKLHSAKEEMQQEHEVSMQKLRDELNSRKDTEVILSPTNIQESHENVPKARFWICLLFIILQMSCYIFLSEKSFTPLELSHDGSNTENLYRNDNKCDMPFPGKSEIERNLSHLDCQRTSSLEQPVAFIKKQNGVKDKSNTPTPRINVKPHQTAEVISSNNAFNGHIGTIESQESRYDVTDNNGAATVFDSRNQKNKMKGIKNISLIPC
jgi:Oxidation resistance protein